LPFTVRTSSIFEGSKVELIKWFKASYELSVSKKGISSVELATRIGVSQKTAWFINHRLRAMLTETNPELLTGTVEIDESFVGGLEKNKHVSKKVKRSKISRTLDEKIVTPKTAVLGLLQRDGKVRTFVVPNTQGATLNPIMRAKVETNSRIITDGWVPYKEATTHAFQLRALSVVILLMAISTPTTSRATGAF
jgi:hypothetical protein